MLDILKSKLNTKHSIHHTTQQSMHYKPILDRDQIPDQDHVHDHFHDQNTTNTIIKTNFVQVEHNEITYQVIVIVVEVEIDNIVTDHVVEIDLTIPDPDQDTHDHVHEIDHVHFPEHDHAHDIEIIIPNLDHDQDRNHDQITILPITDVIAVVLPNTKLINVLPATQKYKFTKRTEKI